MKRQQTNPISKRELKIRQQVSIIQNHITRFGTDLIPGFAPGQMYESWEYHFNKQGWAEAVKRVLKLRASHDQK